MGRLKDQWRARRPELVTGILFFLTRGVTSTLRVRAENFPLDDSKAIFCGWHGKSLVFANYFRNRSYWVIISHSKDGDIQSSIFKRLGFRVIRGSTGRGGVRAAIEGIRALKEGGTMAMTPDGPRGPSGVVQGGVMLMAQRSGAKLIPVGIYARPRWHAGSWDRYMVPLPFGKAVLLFGEPICVPEDASPEEVEEIRLTLESEINRLEVDAERKLGYGVKRLKG